jgi:hypothetical protein
MASSVYLCLLRPHAAVTCFLLLLAGCSGGRKAVPVSGRVTLDGQPVADVYVSFQPVAATDINADAMGSTGITDQEGKFTLSLSDTQAPGALAGKHAVRLSDKRASSSSDGGPSSAPKPRFPTRYADGSLSFEVPPDGTSQADFKLSSK